MTIQYVSAKVHWNYFLAIERDFEIVTRFIEPCEANNDTFSVELARIIMGASQEVDVVMKGLCKLKEGGQSRDNIHQYFPVVTRHIPNFLDQEVQISRFGMSSKPWIDWQSNKPPLWWTANNKIKHTRDEHFNKATLKNGYNAVGALLITTAFYYFTELKLENENATWWEATDGLHVGVNLFRLCDEFYRPTVSVGALEW